ncbi:hypothetical protein F5879DRAFT_1027839 [Lentinula edodes]|nr:hypothetical protein F5879DRAFT_1027839 [Lentinula edodes]
MAIAISSHFPHGLSFVDSKSLGSLASFPPSLSPLTLPSNSSPFIAYSTPELRGSNAHAIQVFFGVFHRTVKYPYKEHAHKLKPPRSLLPSFSAGQRQDFLLSPNVFQDPSTHMCTLERISYLLSLLLLIISVKPAHAIPTPAQISIKGKDARMRKIVLGAPGGDLDPDWILGFYGDDTYLDEADKKVFEKNLDLVVGSHRDECSGAYNKGIYTLLKDYEVGGVNHGKDTVIVKVIGGVGNPESTVDNKVWGEVKALKDVDLYIDSGMAKFGDGKYPVIVMKLVEGVMIKETNEYLDAKVDQRTKWLEEAKAHVKKEVVQNAVQKGVLHTDLNSYKFVVGGADTSDGPTLTTPITEARLVDWGYPGVFKVKNGVTETEVKKWFELQWKKKIKA